MPVTDLDINTHDLGVIMHLLKQSQGAHVFQLVCRWMQVTETQI
jgi:hypothetical protein